MILSESKNQRRRFNIKRTADIEVFKNFMANNNSWGSGGCPFILEYPYTSVPDMIKDKLIRKMLKLPEAPTNSFRNSNKGETNVNV